MTVLTHNTSIKNAKRIIGSRVLLANMERGQNWLYSSGPFFYYQDQTEAELPSGGAKHPVDLRFLCTLPVLRYPRRDINSAIIGGNYTHLEGHIVLYENDINGRIEQAMIIPDNMDCLSLISIENSQDGSDLRKNCQEHEGMFSIARPNYSA